MADHPSWQPEESGGETMPEEASVAGRRQALPRTDDYREQLRSRRWNAAPLRNPEVEKTDPRIAVAFIVILSAVTLIVLVAGYASGFWSLPQDEVRSGAVAALELLA